MLPAIGAIEGLIVLFLYLAIVGGSIVAVVLLVIAVRRIADSAERISVALHQISVTLETGARPVGEGANKPS